MIRGILLLCAMLCAILCAILGGALVGCVGTAPLRTDEKMQLQRDAHAGRTRIQDLEARLSELETENAEWARTRSKTENSVARLRRLNRVQRQEMRAKERRIDTLLRDLRERRPVQPKGRVGPGFVTFDDLPARFLALADEPGRSVYYVTREQKLFIGIFRNEVTDRNRPSCEELLLAMIEQRRFHLDVIPSYLESESPRAFSDVASARRHATRNHLAGTYLIHSENESAYIVNLAEIGKVDTHRQVEEQLSDANRHVRRVGNSLRLLLEP